MERVPREYDYVFALFVYNYHRYRYNKTTTIVNRLITLRIFHFLLSVSFAFSEYNMSMLILIVSKKRRLNLMSRYE